MSRSLHVRLVALVSSAATMAGVLATAGSAAVPGGVERAGRAGQSDPVAPPAYVAQAPPPASPSDPGTGLVVDLGPGRVVTDPMPLADVDGVAYFNVVPGFGALPELWRSDGTPAGTRSLGLRGVSEVVAAEGQHFLVIDGDLWRAGPDDEDLTRLADLPWPVGSVVTLDDRALFHASADHRCCPSDSELWLSDGTIDGTRRVADINPGPDGSDPHRLTVVGDEVWFAADDGTHGVELWRSDGTADGTRLVEDSVPGGSPEDPHDPDAVDYSSHPDRITPAGDRAFYRSRHTPRSGRLWVSDGTAEGTHEVTDRSGRTWYPESMVALGDRVLWSAVDGLWISDGTPAGTRRVSSAGASGPNERITLVVVGETAFFPWTDRNGTELWRTDGTPGGTTQVVDLVAPTGSSSADGGPVLGLTPAGSLLYFLARDGTKPGWVLWSSDGSATGTRRVDDLDTTAPAETPTALTEVGGELFFVLDGESRREVHSTATPDASQPRVVSTRPAHFRARPVVGEPVELEEGGYLPTGAALTYEWPGRAPSPDPTFVPDASMLGRPIDVRIRGAAVGHRTRELVVRSLPVFDRIRNVERPRIVGRLRVGHRVRAEVGAWSPEQVRTSCTWYAGGRRLATSRATCSTVLPSWAAGRRLVLVVTASRTSWYDARASSRPAQRIARAAPTR